MIETIPLWEKMQHRRGVFFLCRISHDNSPFNFNQYRYRVHFTICFEINVRIDSIDDFFSISLFSRLLLILSSFLMFDKYVPCSDLCRCAYVTSTLPAMSLFLFFISSSIRSEFHLSVCVAHIMIYGFRCSMCG